MIYLDNAATTYPKPPGVLKAVVDCIERIGGNPGRGAHALSLLASEEVYNARCAAAEFLGVNDPSTIVFIPNATFGLNLAIRCRVKPGDHILLSDQEHNAVLRPVVRLRDEGIADYSIFSATDPIADVKRKENRRTAVLICNPVSNVTGDKVPILEVAKYAKDRGYFLILDGSQWIGHGTPDPDVVKLADAIAVPGHKGLYGIQGSGFIYLKSAERCAPFVLGGSGSLSANPRMPEYLPDRYEAGTLSTPAIVSLAAGIRFLNEYGADRLVRHEDSLRRYAWDRLSEIKGVALYGRKDNGSSVLSFSMKDVSPEETARRLDQAGIAVRAGLHCAPMIHKTLCTFPNGTVRIGFGAFNTQDDVDQLLYELIKMQ